MNDARAYAAALARYGRAPAEGVADFASRAAFDGLADPHNNRDAVFADWLEEHDDPRHMIVRRDLGYRGGDGWAGFHDRKSRHADELAGRPPTSGSFELGNFPAGDGTDLSVYYRDHGDTPIYHVNWDTSGHDGNNYMAVLTRGELEHVFAGLGLEPPSHPA